MGLLFWDASFSSVFFLSLSTLVSFDEQFRNTSQPPGIFGDQRGLWWVWRTSRNMCVLPFVYYTSLNEQLGSLSNFLSKNQNLGPVVHTQHHYLYSFYLCEVGWLSISSISWFPTKPYFSFITSQASCLAMPPACCLVIFSYSCNCTLIANLNDLFFIFTYTCQ